MIWIEIKWRYYPRTCWTILGNCLMNLKNSGDSTGFENPMTSVMPVQCSNQLSYEITQLRAGQFVGRMFSRERNVVWNKCYMKCGVWNQMKIWSSHLLDNLSNCLMNLKNSGDSMVRALHQHCKSGLVNYLIYFSLAQCCDSQLSVWSAGLEFKDYYESMTLEWLNREIKQPRVQWEWCYASLNTAAPGEICALFMETLTIVFPLMWSQRKI